MKGIQRIISGWLAICMVFSMLPVQVFATETEPAMENVAAETVPEETAAETTAPTEAPTAHTEAEPEPTVETVALIEETVESQVSEEAVNVDTTASGTCGENLTWTLDSEGVLTISGTGPMASYGDQGYGQPWDYMDVSAIVIEEGVTSIGSFCFWYLDAVSITIPSTLTSIGSDAFGGCKLLDVYISDFEAWSNINFGGFGKYSRGTPFNYASNLYLNGELVTEYTFPEGTTTIRNMFYGVKCLTKVTIPDGVTKIDSSAFANCTGLTNIELPETVTQIGAMAFSGCSGLNSMTLPKNVKSIGNDAFSGCSALTSFEIPEGITTIGMDTFSACSNLTSITIPKSVTSIAQYAFWGSNNLTDIYYGGSQATWANVKNHTGSDNGSLTSATVHFAEANEPCGDDLLWEYDEANYILTIRGTGPMYNYTEQSRPPWDALIYLDVKQIIVEEGVTTIGDYAFEGAWTPAKASLPESLVSIGAYAFQDCFYLKEISIPDSVTEIKDYAFHACGFTKISLPSKLEKIGSYVFYSCDALTEVIIPDTLTFLGEGMFAYCSALPAINIPEGITAISKSFCSYCENLTTVTIPSTVVTIGSDAFLRCSKLSSINIPEGVSEISYAAFSSCTKLKSVALPSTLQTIGPSAFSYCTQLAEIVIPDGVTSIGSSTFGSCSNLTNVSIPSSVTSIGASAFSYCEKLTDVSLPEGMTEIPESFFEGCIALSTITLPQRLESIGGYAFSECSSLQEIQLPVKLKSIGDGAFVGCSSLREIQLPEKLESIGDEIFYGCTSLTSITLPKSLSVITNSAFGNCNALTDIYYTGTEEQWAELLASTDPEYNAPLFNEELQVHCNWVEEPEQSLRFPIDYWTFDNHNSVFGDVADGYFITQADYDRLVLNIPKPTPDYYAHAYYSVTTKQFSESLDTFRRYNIHDPLLLRYDGVEYPVREWSGSCYGMSTWTCLVNNGVLQAADIDGITQKLSDYTFNQDVESAINFYQWQQELSAVYSASVSWSYNEQEQQLRHLETLGKAANETGEAFVVLFHWYELETDDNGEQYFENYAHAVNGYGWEQIEPRTITVNGHTATYDRRILIYDCSDPNEEYDNHIYYNDEYVCCIPAWNFSSLDRNVTESLTDLSNNGQLQYATKDPNFLNLIDYRTGEANLDPDLSRVQTDMGVEYQIECEGEMYEVTATSIRGGSTENKPLLWFMTNINSDRSAGAESAITILPQGVRSCSINSEDSLEFRFITPDSAAMISADQPGKVQFHQDGTVSMETRNPADYDIMMQLQITDNSLPWSQIQLRGSGASEVAAKSTEAGIVISADHMENMSVIISRGEENNTTTLTAEDQVLLTHKDGKPLFLLDRNQDGIFEEVLKDCSKGHTEKTIAGKAATCTETGLTEGKHCSVCNAILVAQETIAALGHKWTTADCDTPKTCFVCKATEGKVLGHSYDDNVDGTCNSCGVNRETVESRQVTHMLRMYNPYTGEHFYTGSVEEKDNLVAVGWNYEGVAFTFPSNTGAPVHRLYDPVTGEHLYTMNEEEKATLEDAGWNYEGIAFNSAYDTEAVQHRLHNPYATVGAYHFTFSDEEKQNLINAGWEYQGIGWYSCWK